MCREQHDGDLFVSKRGVSDDSMPQWPAGVVLASNRNMLIVAIARVFSSLTLALRDVFCYNEQYEAREKPTARTTQGRGFFIMIFDSTLGLSTYSLMWFF